MSHSAAKNPLSAKISPDPLAGWPNPIPVFMALPKRPEMRVHSQIRYWSENQRRNVEPCQFRNLNTISRRSSARGLSSSPGCENPFRS
jgi:hypothetical protein